MPTSPALIERTDRAAGALDCLVVGGVSPIGGALVAALSARGRCVEFTSRRPESADGLYLDLATLQGLDALPPARHLALVAAETSFARCQAEPERTAQINIEAPLRLAERTLRDGGRVLFFSTGAVHDGSVDRPGETAEPRPNSVYGKQKLAAERSLLGLDGDVAILRPGKVIDPNFALWRGWLDCWQAGRRVEAFADMVVAPIALDFLADIAARLLVDSDATGVFQLSAEDQLSYATIADHLARRIGVRDELVVPVAAAARPDAASLWLPTYARLGCDRLVSALRVSPPPALAAADFFLRAQGQSQWASAS